MSFGKTMKVIYLVSEKLHLGFSLPENIAVLTKMKTTLILTWKMKKNLQQFQFYSYRDNFVTANKYWSILFQFLTAESGYLYFLPLYHMD